MVAGRIRPKRHMYDFAHDPIGILCLAQAEKCKSYIGFGAVLVKDGQVVGVGRNRRATLQDRLEMSRVDYAIHAEQDAILDAIRKGVDVQDTTVYVLGKALKGPNKGQLTVRTMRGFGCAKCPHILQKYNISVHIPHLSGWLELSPDEAMSTAKQFQGDGKWRRFSQGANIL